MAVRGQRFTLDPDANDFAFNLEAHEPLQSDENTRDFIGEIREREPVDAPPSPKQKQTKTGFPQHRPLKNVSAFKKRQNQAREDEPHSTTSIPTQVEPSDRAITHHIKKKYGHDSVSKEKDDISEENKRRLEQMSVEDIEEARSELMSNLSPAFIQRLLKRANIEEDQQDRDWDESVEPTPQQNQEESVHSQAVKSISFSPNPQTDEPSHGTATENEQISSAPSDSTGTIKPQFEEVMPSTHFPQPPRNPDDYIALDPNSPSFLADLKQHYFPSVPDDPSTLSWLQDPTPKDGEASPYAPARSRYAPSDIRFDFHGRLLAPNDSRKIPVDRGLHHHGEAPESAGYTIPELTTLARSSLPNQRCMAYQVLGRILYRLGRGDFGPRGSELQEGLWACIEKERPLEVIMSEANRTGGHISAKSYATEALWLWRKGGGGERGILKPGEKVAK